MSLNFILKILWAPCYGSQGVVLKVYSPIILLNKRLKALQRFKWLPSEMSIFLKRIILLLVVVQRHRTPLPSSNLLFFICRDIFKLHATINVNESDENSLPRIAYSFMCTSDYESFFYSASETHWKRGQCNIAGCKIECPVFEPFKTYSVFFLWKTNTLIVKTVYEVNGTEFITLGRPVIPYIQCRNITRIGPNDEIFSEPDQKHKRKCCPC